MSFLAVRFKSSDTNKRGKLGRCVWEKQLLPPSHVWVVFQTKKSNHWSTRTTGLVRVLQCLLCVVYNFIWAHRCFKDPFNSPYEYRGRTASVRYWPYHRIGTCASVNTLRCFHTNPGKLWNYCKPGVERIPRWIISFMAYCIKACWIKGTVWFPLIEIRMLLLHVHRSHLNVKQDVWLCSHNTA